MKCPRLPSATRQRVISRGSLPCCCRSANCCVRHPRRDQRGAARKLRRQASVLIARRCDRHRRADVRVRCPRDRSDAAARHPQPVAGSYPDRFGKAAFVLWFIAALLIVVMLVAPMARDSLRARLLRLVTELQYLLLAVLVPIAAGELIKWIVGRGRPFVGGHANAFYFSHFRGTVGLCQLSIGPCHHQRLRWPSRSRRCGRGCALPMIVYALLIMASRLVLLAHHPERRGRGRLVRRDRRDGRAVLVCGPLYRLRDRPRWRHIAAHVAPSRNRKGVAGGRSAP